VLVVAGNWGIGDGSLRDAPPARVTAFVDDLRRSAVLAGWQETGRYETVDGIDLVLAGDTLDWYASRHWTGTARPWRRDADSRRVGEAVVRATLLRARRVLAPLVRLTREGLALPGADRRGRPTFDASVVVPVRVTLLEGNLDAGLGGALGRLAASALELPVGSACEAEGVAVEHGHGGDAAWSSATEGPLLGASVRIDLIARYLAAPEVTRLPEAWRQRLAGRLLASDALDCGALCRAATVPEADADGRRRLEQAWWRSVEDWRRAAWGDGVGRVVPFDLLDALADRLLRPSPAGEGDELARLLRPVVTSRASSAVLGHLPVSRSEPSGTPRTAGLGGAGAAADGPVPGVCEIPSGAERLALPPAVVVPRGGRGPFRACPAGAIPPEWTGIPAVAPPAAPRRRVVEAA